MPLLQGRKHKTIEALRQFSGLVPIAEIHVKTLESSLEYIFENGGNDFTARENSKIGEFMQKLSLYQGDPEIRCECGMLLNETQIRRAADKLLVFLNGPRHSSSGH